VIEGAKMTVCTGCSKHGKLVWEEEPKPKAVIAAKGPRTPLHVQIQKPAGPTVDTSLELVHDFHNKIREAREKLGLSHEDLGKKINEKVSLLRKIETGKMTPDNNLAVRLEHTLKVKLIVPATEEKIPEAKIPKAPSRDLTLGDLIKINEKSKERKEEPAGRKQS
jgi:putative transcription factor